MAKYQNRFLTEDEVKQLLEGYSTQRNNEQTTKEKRNKKFLKHIQTNMPNLISIHN